MHVSVTHMFLTIHMLVLANPIMDLVYGLEYVRE